jgi:hypothetical protein
MKEIISKLSRVGRPGDFNQLATTKRARTRCANPADLRVEQPKKFEFIINLQAAKQIGLTIPLNVLVRADKVIK